MIKAFDAFSRTKANLIVAQDQEIKSVERAITEQTRLGEFYLFVIIKFPKTIETLREYGYDVQWDELAGYKISWSSGEEE